MVGAESKVETPFVVGVRHGWREVPDCGEDEVGLAMVDRGVPRSCVGFFVGLSPFVVWRFDSTIGLSFEVLIAACTQVRCSGEGEGTDPFM